MTKLLPLVLALVGASLNSFGMQPAGPEPAQTTASASSASRDVAIVRERFVASVLPAGSVAIEYLHEQGAKDAATLEADGSWPDIDYTAAQRSGWVTADHVQRILVMAKSARVYRDAGSPDTALEGKILLALKWWTDHDYKNSN